MTADEIAHVAYAVNRAYCEAIGDAPPLPWPVVMDSLTAAVLEQLVAPRSPEASHMLWMQEKVRDGWIYGEVKDPIAKTHPCLRPFGELSLAQRAKDFIFCAIVRALR